jgi:hypothetical protein
MKTHRRVLGCAGLVGVMGALAGCAGTTLPPTNVTSTSATANGTASCDGTGYPCYYRFKAQRVGSQGPVVLGYEVGPITAPTGLQPVTQQLKLEPGAQYTYWICGKGDNYATYQCANPVTFTTQP